MDPPIRHPLSILSRLTSLPPTPFTLPDGTTLHPPAPSGVAPRKLVLFGDCDGGTPNPTFREMCTEPSLLVHECTNALISPALQKGEKGRQVRVKGLEHSMVKKIEIQRGDKIGAETCEINGHGPDCAEERRAEEAKREEVRQKAKARGHSTPKEVGEFARVIRPKRLVVNHFSAM
jgi:ribonuclease Z